MNTPTTPATVAIVFDGDDTLWLTQRIYWQAREQYLAVMTGLGLDRDASYKRFESIDLANIPTWKLSKHRFPHSMVQAYRELTAEAGRTADPAVEAEIRAIGYSVFEIAPELIAGAREVLEALRAIPGVRVMLMTAGDPEVQNTRIDTSGLRHLFHAIYIPELKKTDDYVAMLEAEGLHPASVWMVGNSLKSDIIPAHTAGMRTAYLASGSAWAYDKVDGAPSETVTIQALLDLLTHVQPVLA